MDPLQPTPVLVREELRAEEQCFLHSRNAAERFLCADDITPFIVFIFIVSFLILEMFFIISKHKKNLHRKKRLVNMY